MFENFNRKAGLSLKPSSSRFLLLWLLLAAVAVQSAPSAPVRAAPANQEGGQEGEVRYNLGIYLPDPPICAGQDYDIRVNLVASRYVWGRASATGNPQWVARSLPGHTIEASVRNPSIGTISPEKLVTGFDVDQDAPGEATFTFHAKKAGTTELYFETLIRKAITGTKDEYIGPVKTIEVVNCKYKVKMTYQMRQSSGGAVGLIIGNMDTLVEGDGATYQGAGTLHTDRTEAMAPCSFSTPGFDSATTLTMKPAGTPDDQQLELAIEYEPAQSSSTITCPIVGAKITNTTEDPSNWLAENATFSENGGARSFPINFAQWFGRLIITVEPVEANS